MIMMLRLDEFFCVILGESRRLFFFVEYGGNWNNNKIKRRPLFEIKNNLILYSKHGLDLKDDVQHFWIKNHSHLTHFYFTFNRHFYVKYFWFSISLNDMYVYLLFIKVQLYANIIGRSYNKKNAKIQIYSIDILIPISIKFTEAKNPTNNWLT